MLCVCVKLTSRQSEEQWAYVLSHFLVDELYILGGYQPTTTVFRAATQIQSLLELPPHDLVLMAPILGRYVNGDTPLNTFQHPVDAIYLFGSDNDNFTDADFADRMYDSAVYIPTDTDDEMFSWVAGAVVLWCMRQNG